jgi:hypothetical protein
MKCIVKDCKNHSHQGKFIGDLCSPCYQFITTGEGVYSQVYRNTIAATKEKAAKIAEMLVTKQHKHINYGKPFQDHMHWEDIAAAIRRLK